MVRRVLLRIGDFLFVLRPLILIPVWSFFILGMRSGRSAPTAGSGGATGVGLACLTAVMITAYLINQVFDQESDRRNDKGHYLTRGIFSVRTVVLLALVFFAAASLLFQNTAPPQRLPLALALVFSLVYSLPPIRLCARPFLDLVVNALGYGGIAYLTGYLAFDDSWSRGAAHAAPFVLLVGATFLHTTILDIEGDRASGKRTSSVALGIGPSALLAVVLVGGGLGWAIGIAVAGHGLLPVGVLGLAAPAFALAYTEMSGHAAELDVTARAASRTVQYATALVTIPAAVAVPAYVGLLVPLVLASRVYHRARFGFAYPGRPGAAHASADRTPTGS